ncbi:hypothetical protein R3P38DRAFT_3295458 [Favolaschia claudopus]|uniref:Proteophosphoglycan ppg4 n=1 Tax=Favolaschia claudopus TaxID=2862362 RepID=A0AAV9ZBV1_9AGAR
MPRLADIFTRRQNDSSSQQSHSRGSSTSQLPAFSSSTSTASSVITAEDSLSLPVPAQPIPSSPNGKNKNSSSRNGLGGFFGRKKSKTELPLPPPNYVQEEVQPAYFSRPSTSSALTARSGSYASPTPAVSTLHPPHRMGTALSTRSLPTLQIASSSNLPLHPLSPLSSEIAADSSLGETNKSAGGKSGKKFAFWTRGAADSLTKDAESEGDGGVSGSRGAGKEGHVGSGDEFNLRAFRQVGPAALPILDTHPSPSYSPDDMPRRPRPRERGGSDASNASSRISVAAFREAVAKRERERETGRMSPSFGVGGAPGSTVSNVVSATTTPQPSFSSTPARSFSPSPHPPIAAARPRRQLPASATPTDAATSEDESDSDSDNTPLATLLPPRRPGSAMSAGSAASHASSSHTSPRPKPKPLIDIAALTATKPGVARVKKEENGDGFTGAGMLANERVLTSRSPPVRSLTADADLPKTGLMHFPSPPSTPVREVPPPLQSSTGTGVTMKRDALRETLRAVAGSGDGAGNGKRVEAELVKSTPYSIPANSQNPKKLTSSSSTTTTPSSQRAPNPPPPPTFTSPSPSSTTAARKTFHRRFSSDIISTAPKVTWADDVASDPYRDSVLAGDLAAMLGGGIALVSVGLDDEDYAGGGGDVFDGAAGTREAAAAERAEDLDEERGGGGGVVPPIVIRQRSPSPAFSVTSRPAHVQNRSLGAGVELGGSSGRRNDVPLQTRQRSSSTMLSPPVSSSSATVTGTFGRLERSEASAASSSTSAATLGTPPQAFSSSTPLADVRALAKTSSIQRESLPRQRSSTMTPLIQQSQLRTMPPTSRSSTLPPTAHTPSTSLNPSSSRANLAPRSLRTVASNSSLSSASSKLPASISAVPPPRRPFVPSGRLSPTSSTGESSSDPALLTPWDWSDTGGSSGEERGRWRGGVRELVARRGGVRRRSVSSSSGFGSDERYGGVGRGKGRMMQKDERASRALELGNDDTDEGGFDSDDLPLNQARMMGVMGMGMGGNMPMNIPMTPAMGMNMPTSFAFPSHPGTPAAGWGGGMLNPQQFMMPPPADPAFYAAHQQAMMIAKQAYLTAVGQQAMAAAGEEWERGSSVGGSVYGGAGGGGGSVYGAGGGSVYGGGGGMGGWGPSLFPPGPQSMYGGGGGGARSEYGGGGGARSDYGGGERGNWNSSRSVYGESFGPSPDRYARTSSSTNLSVTAGRGGRESTGYFPPVTPSSRGRGGMQMQPRQRTASQPADPSQNVGSSRRPPPPSCWRKPTS